MWRLIGIVIVLLIYLIFILLNQDTRSVVSLGFLRFESVHTYVITFFAFAAGIIISGIFSIVAYFKRRKKAKSAEMAAITGATAIVEDDTPIIVAAKNADSGKDE
jgi:uncharacterized integral membrane protein